MAYFTDTAPLSLSYVPPRVGRQTALMKLAGYNADGTSNAWGKALSFVPLAGQLGSSLVQQQAASNKLDDVAAAVAADGAQRAQTGGAVLNLVTGIARTAGGDPSGLGSALQGGAGLLAGLSAPAPPPPPGRQTYAAFDKGGHVPLINGEPLLMIDQRTGQAVATAKYGESINDVQATRDMARLANEEEYTKLGKYVAKEMETWPTPKGVQPYADGGYVVRRGDTLSALAARLGTSVQALAQANGITNVNLIREGQRLNLPTQGRAEVAFVPQTHEAAPSAGFTPRPGIHAPDGQRGVRPVMRTEPEARIQFGGGSYGGAGAGETYGHAETSPATTSLKPVVVLSGGGLRPRRQAAGVHTVDGGTLPGVTIRPEARPYVDASPIDPRQQGLLPVAFQNPTVPADAGRFDTFIGPPERAEYVIAGEEKPYRSGDGYLPVQFNSPDVGWVPQATYPAAAPQAAPHRPSGKPAARRVPSAQTLAPDGFIPAPVVTGASPYRGAVIPGDRAAVIDSTYVVRPASPRPYAKGGYLGEFNAPDWTVPEVDPPVRGAYPLLASPGLATTSPVGPYRGAMAAPLAGAPTPVAGMGINAPSDLSLSLARSVASPVVATPSPLIPTIQGGTLGSVTITARRAGSGGGSGGGGRAVSAPDASTPFPNPGTVWQNPSASLPGKYAISHVLEGSDGVPQLKTNLNANLQARLDARVDGKASPQTKANAAAGGGGGVAKKGNLTNALLDGTRLLTGLSAAGTPLPAWENTPAWERYVADTEQAATQGLTSAERTAAERGAGAAQQVGNDAVLATAGGGGNASAVLAGLSGQTARATGAALNLEATDAGLRRQNRAALGQVLAQDQAYDLNKFANAYQGAAAQKQTGVNLLGQTMADIEGRTNFQSDFGAGSAYQRLLEAYQKKTGDAEASLTSPGFMAYLKKMTTSAAGTPAAKIP